MPMGMTGALVMAASRAAPHRPFSSGSKKARPRGMVPCGMSATTSPACRASAAAARGSSEPVPRSTRMPPMAAAMLADDRRVEHLLLAEEAHRPADLRDGACRWPWGRSSCGGCRRGWPGPSAGMCSVPGDVEASAGEQLRDGEGLERPAVARCRPTLGTPAGTSRCCCGHRRTSGHQPEPGIGVHRHRVGDRRQQRQVVDAVGVGPALARRRRRGPPPSPAPPASLPRPHTKWPAMVPS